MLDRSEWHDPNLVFAGENGSCWNFVGKLAESGVGTVNKNLRERFAKEKILWR